MPSPLKIRHERAAKGICTNCGKRDARPGLKDCERCALKKNEARLKGCWRHLPPSFWDTLDWAKNDAQLAREAGKTKVWIAVQRRRREKRLAA